MTLTHLGPQPVAHTLGGDEHFTRIEVCSTFALGDHAHERVELAGGPGAGENCLVAIEAQEREEVHNYCIVGDSAEESKPKLLPKVYSHSL